MYIVFYSGSIILKTAVRIITEFRKIADKKLMKKLVMMTTIFLKVVNKCLQRYCKRPTANEVNCIYTLICLK